MAFFRCRENLKIDWFCSSTNFQTDQNYIIERLFYTHRGNQCTESVRKYDLHNDYLRFKTMDQLLTAKIYEFWIWAWPYAWFSRQCHEIKNIFLICNNNIYLCIYTDLKENGAFNRTSIWVKTVYLVIGLRL